MEAAVDLQLIQSGADKKMSFYTKGPLRVNAENFNLLGFKNNYPVLEPSIIKVEYVSLIKSQLELGKQAQQLYNWKGRIIKIVPSGQIPKAVKEQTMKLKKQGRPTTAAGAKGRNPAANHVPVEHVNRDNGLNIPCTNQDLGQLIRPAGYQVIHSSTAESSGFPANPPIADSQAPDAVKPAVPILNDPSALISCVDSSSEASDSPGRILPAIGSRSTKLLSKKNLAILNKAKMKALNLSMKANMDGESGKEVAVQTDQLETKQFCHQQVQTDPSQQFDLVDYMTLNLDNLLDINNKDESPIINDVRLDNGLIMNGPEFNSIPNPISSQAQNSPDGKSTDNKQVLKMKMMFFHDLRECMNYNAAGNLPVHEGVLKNDLVAVKRQCAALKARKCGVNLGNHDGCIKSPILLFPIVQLVFARVGITWIKPDSASASFGLHSTVKLACCPGNRFVLLWLGRSGLTPLQLAIVNNVQVEIVFILLESGGDLQDIDGDGNNVLHLAAKFERLGAMQMILNHCCFMSCFDCINSYNFEGLTPLMICCASSWTEGALLLIDREACVNLRDQRSGKTALFHAAEAQNVEIVRALLQNGADPKLKNFFGTSPHDAMYELDDMVDTIKRLIFGITKKRSNAEAEMNPSRTANAAKKLKTYRKFQKIKLNGKFPMYTMVQK
ncbi:hypothetical protein YQE_08369, partial [Dendroctonus ponderosae]